MAGGPAVLDLQHLVVKLPVEGALVVDPAEFILVFHRWVAAQAMPELLVDVADLRHVPNGPGVVLVGLQADYALDHGGGVWGLLYRRKDVVDGTNADRIRQAVGSVARAARRLETEFAGRLALSRTTLDLVVNDRALAPNTAETRADATPEIEAAVATLVAGATVKAHDGDPRSRFGAAIVAGAPFDLEVLGGQ